MNKFQKSFYQVFECSNPNDYWSYDITKVLFESDDLAKAHSYAYTQYNEKHQTKFFVIIQPYDGSCRGGYGFTVKKDDEEPEMNISIVRDNLQKTIAGKESYLANAIKIRDEQDLTLEQEVANYMTIQFLKINIDELRRILTDVESCCQTHGLICKAV
jgi:hypothetical protein